jgi:hypothetical protein
MIGAIAAAIVERLAPPKTRLRVARDSVEFAPSPLSLAPRMRCVVVVVETKYTGLVSAL